MTVNLTKGESLSLSKTHPQLAKVRIGLGWKPALNAGAQLDLDASVLVLGADNRAFDEEHSFIFFNHRRNAQGSIEHLGDNRSGVGEGDDEQIKINLKALPENMKRLLFLVNIYQAKAREQSFRDVYEAYIRLINEETGEEIARHALSTGEYQESTGVFFGKLCQEQAGEWQFIALGQGTTLPLNDLVYDYGFR